VKKLGADHPITLATLLNLAQTYRATGKTAEAIVLYEQVRDACVKKLGADHPLTLVTLDNLAGAYLLNGKTAEAIALFEQVRDARVKKLGVDHPHTLITLNNLAGAYRDAGKTAEAIALLKQVRDVRISNLGADHPHTLDTLAGLALAYEAAGKPEQALPLLQQAALGVEKRQFVHANAGPIIGAMIDYYERQKKYDQAEAWRRKWLTVVKERSGAESLPYAMEMALLGRNLLKQKRWTDAEATLHDCLAIREKKQPDDWTTFNAKSMLGEALNGQMKRAEA
jgi:tetratricopeptide (TPR) repeat protein